MSLKLEFSCMRRENIRMSWTERFISPYVCPVFFKVTVVYYNTEPSLILIYGFVKHQKKSKGMHH